jgi:hypothetical protein
MLVILNLKGVDTVNKEYFRFFSSINKIYKSVNEIGLFYYAYIAIVS